MESANTFTVPSGDDLVRLLDQLRDQGRYGELEDVSRQALAQHKFFVWHMYLIVALLRQARRDEAARELDALFAYKFNLADRAWPEIREAFPERFSSHFVLSTMKPELGLETQSQFARHWDVAFPLDTQEAFAAQVDALLAAAVPSLPALSRESTRVATFGSCFAANLAQALKRAGVDANNLLIEESINSPLANREFLAAIDQGPSARHYGRIREEFGAEFLERARERLAQADVLVITMGVAPAMFYRETNEFAFLVNHKELLRARAIYMRTPGVEEIKAITRDALRHVRSINPRARTYLSISPVPLAGSIELPHAVLADCVSKSTLRAALHEMLAREAGSQLVYWPSFEIVRWLGAHTSTAVFGADDRASRHVSNWVVDLIVDRFSRHLFADR